MTAIFCLRDHSPGLYGLGIAPAAVDNPSVNADAVRSEYSAQKLEETDRKYKFQKREELKKEVLADLKKAIDEGQLTLDHFETIETGFTASSVIPYNAINSVSSDIETQLLSALHPIN